MPNTMPMDRITGLVTNADHPTALGSARALRAAGAEVIGVTHEPGQCARRSRAWSQVVATDQPDDNSAMERILDIACLRDRGPFLRMVGDWSRGAVQRMFGRPPAKPSEETPT